MNTTTSSVAEVKNFIINVLNEEPENFYAAYLEYMDPRWAGSSDTFDDCAFAINMLSNYEYEEEDIREALDDDSIWDTINSIFERFYDEKDFEVEDEEFED